MALTRKLLKGMGLEDEQIDTIIDNHSDTVNALKDQIQEYKDEVAKLSDVQKDLATAQKELEAVKHDDYQAKYEQLEKEFEKYKEERESEDIHQAKVNAYRKLLRDAGISEKRIDAVLKVSDIDAIELEADGKIKDASKLKESIKSEWADFIQTQETHGASTPNPPANTGGSVANKDEIVKMKDPVARQNAIAENLELFDKSKGE